MAGRKPQKHVMVDCETLAVAPNAAVIQVGFCYFDDQVNSMRLANYSCSPTHYKERQDFAWSIDTLQWHLEKNPENLREIERTGGTIESIAQAVRSEVLRAGYDKKYAVQLWACGTDFDIPILNNLLAVCGLKPPWAYNCVRDFRTLRELHRDTVPNAVKNNHSAVFDAQNQYQHLMRILVQMGYTDGVVHGY